MTVRRFAGRMKDARRDEPKLAAEDEPRCEAERRTIGHEYVLLTTLFLPTRCLELVPLLPSERVGNRTCAINHPLPVYLTWPILLDTFADEKQHCKRRIASRVGESGCHRDGCEAGTVDLRFGRWTRRRMTYSATARLITQPVVMRRHMTTPT